ncbi:MAG: valine--tRNA ligase [Deltaproteobacteria bacterium]|nr:valine--tRNA ligase [Deltaproteobacteria bacterium]
MSARVLEKVYDPREAEARWYAFWLEQGYFRADERPAAEPFSIVIPPPNVTGFLHIGHALNNTLQDILARYHRMTGRSVLWLPGTDHAGIATQNVVEKELAREGRTRQELGREAFVERVWAWRRQYGGIIIGQLKKLGASCDWSRERFTMDEGLSAAVREVFVRLYEEGLIYRGDYVINWCPRCHTALSDLEVEYEATQGKLYHVRYPLEGGGEVVVATTRPESMLGDTAVAVHPDDPRYQPLLGRMAVLPLVGRRIPVVADRAVDQEFGTGAVKVTPAHDLADFEIGLRHGLDRVTVVGEDGRMTEAAPAAYRGQDRFACRQAVVRDLEAQGLLLKVEPYAHSVGTCYRCRTIIEPTLSKQWFVRTQPLAGPAIEAVRRGDTVFVPKMWEHTYFDWMEKIRDWCISRQIWWGHRIPAWYCDRCGEITVAREAPAACRACGGGALRQDEDVLDTWFSSALWPFSTLGWPRLTRDLERFYPTSVLVTSFDIIFFWVARMMMMGLKFIGRVPFRRVYIHALVRDPLGQKMSKSKGNVIDPLEVIDRYGTDALRFTLAALAAQGRDIRLSDERIAGYRNFVNKLWNAARFTLMNLGPTFQGAPAGGLAGLSREDPALGLADRWILSRLQRVAQEAEARLQEFRFNDAALALYQFVWHELCDWYLEAVKPDLAPDAEPARRRCRQAVLHRVLEAVTRLLHPFMPFVTEEIWQALPHEGASVMVAPYPQADPTWVDEEAEAEWGVVMEVIRAIRNVRAELDVPPAARIEVAARVRDPAVLQRLQAERATILLLARLSALTLGPDARRPPESAVAVARGVELYLSLRGVIDAEEEARRLARELAKVARELDLAGAKLANADFLGKAPPEVVEKEQEKVAQLKEKAEQLQGGLRLLDEMRGSR